MQLLNTRWLVRQMMAKKANILKNSNKTRYLQNSDIYTFAKQMEIVKADFLQSSYLSIMLKLHFIPLQT